MPHRWLKLDLKVRSLLTLCLFAGAAGCGYRPSPGNGVQMCASGPGKTCPTGYYCGTDQLCWRNDYDGGVGRAGAGGSGTGTGGLSGTGARFGTGGVSTGSATTGGDLGKACAAAADCGSGLICLLPTDKLIYGQGGPAHGYCTFACTNVTTDRPKCDGIGGSCVELSPVDQVTQAYCLQNCTTGAAGAASKCHLRQDVACTSLNPDPTGAARAVCLPTCSQDSDCPANRKCDDASAVCVDTKTPGDATGAHCAYDPTGTAADTCAGFCQPIGSGNTLVASFCTRSCVLGSLNGCNFVEKASSLATGGPHAVCFPPDAMAGPGDEGFCLEQCDTANQCSDKADPGVVCDTSVMDLGHGICTWPG